MTARIIDGKEIAKKLRYELAQKIDKEPVHPRLAVIWAGDNEASQIYVRNKQKAAQEVGIDCELFHFDKEVAESDIIALIHRLNHDQLVHGIIVQLPLPEHLNSKNILETIQADKDVDAFKMVMTGALWQNRASWTSATPEGVLYLLKTVISDLSGMHAVVIGRSDIVGKPMSGLLLNEDCTVTITHSKTKNLPEIVKTADIVVAACGQPKMVKKEWIKAGAVVIDVGITKVDGVLYGDVDFEEVKNVAGAITPVPGGVGPMTVAMLLKNTYTAYLKQKNSL
ncbi:MAG: bifunctional 5,10-methylenetetrahydrofolate dehydrogenase/5,10-methenyltetrahydrofolate cyclohydrolase [Alphaproteobacteria bacterium]|nr:bifunctional 5,10-methylenetetrahydrofolate dehydrogenase/5,10-methenyltetrahydrofolate cyclohydrolase [Alphaproteobacteria bacterium]